jgi:beta-lactamase superfamily II metal-dependent hydrolase
VRIIDECVNQLRRTKITVDVRVRLHQASAHGINNALRHLRTCAWAPRYAPAAGASEVLAPDPVRTVNDNSLVVTVEYGGRTILFAGDLEAEGEEALVAAGLPPVDVVKVAHHGSRTSSSARFVTATRPTLAVISCGLANTFGFPADEVLARWRQAGASIARTDLDGAVTVTIGPAGDLVVERYAHRRP